MTQSSPNRRWSILWGCLSLWLAIMLACGCAALIYVLAPPPRLDILVLGLDSRPSEGAAARADSLMLIGANPAGLQMSLLSVPRDLRLDVPGYGVQPINTANMLGEMEAPGSGSDLTAAALEEALGVRIDRTVRMRFEDVSTLIDAAGGVWIDVERTLRDDAYPVSDTQTTVVEFSPGMQWMDGERALQYARTRHADDDYARLLRQQQVGQALARQLRNPLVWPAVWSAYQTIETDLSLTDLFGFAPVLMLNAGRFDQRSIDRSLLTTTAEGGTVVDWNSLRPWVELRFD